MSEKVFLQWNDFKENATSAFEDLRNLGEYSDVTLVSGDGEAVEAHKMVLAASSPVFQNILRQTKQHPRPMIFLRSVKSVDLLAILDFVYKGEANVLSEYLESFFAIAEELELKGLTGQQRYDLLERDPLKKEHIEGDGTNEKNTLSHAQSESTMDEYPNEPINEAKTHPSFNEVLKTETKAGFSNENLRKMISSMMEKTSTASGKLLFSCKACGRETNRNTDIRKHIEAKHLVGVSFPCKICGKVLKTRNLVAVHMNRDHKNRQLPIKVELAESGQPEKIE